MLQGLSWLHVVLHLVRELSPAVQENPMNKPSDKSTIVSPNEQVAPPKVNAEKIADQLSEDDLNIVSGGKHVANIKWTPGRGAT
jgi:hypothetical protein